ncbi:MAG: hypothetical protein Q4F41_15015 [Eubacteriales bacterium]|nr:hypothetical protein [Eubacteriales bacterium]
MEHQIEIKQMNFKAVHTLAEDAVLEGNAVLRVVKKEKRELFDENTYAKVEGIAFHNGIIEVKLLSRLLPDAPDFARGFVGIVYRVKEDDSEFEGFYLRPTNGRMCTDPVRKAHGCQYFSYPGYTFSYFREYGITKYEAQADVDLNEWMNLKAVIQDARAEFYLNGNPEPVLVVEEQKHGIGEKGGVGIFVDIGTEAFVSEMKVTCTD